MKTFLKICIKRAQRFYCKLFTEPAVFKQHKHFFFVHIPKTAGTSFRSAFELTAVTYQDYKNSAKIFSESISQLVYKNNDYYTFKQRFTAQNSAWITGHVKLVKYVDLVSVTHIITFLRHPVKRVISQYQHHVQHHGFTGELSEFITRPITKNSQSRHLDFMPLSLVGYVGITEKYNDSLFLINQQYSLALPLKSKNRNKKSQVSFDSLDDKLKSLIIKNNTHDIALYNEAMFLHESRMQLADQNMPWTYGVVSIDKKGGITGCAYQYENDQAIDLNVKVNNETLACITAQEFYPLYTKANFPRDRYIGFEFELPDYLTSEDVIDIYVKSTGQKLNFKPLIVSKNKC